MIETAADAARDPARDAARDGGPHGPSVAYLVHDLADLAVARRVRMFAAGGARVRVAGFSRRAAPSLIAGAPATGLGRTHDARLLQRAGAVARHLARPGAARAAVAGADVVVARNLETLAIAVRVATPEQRVVYECLDIHRLLTAPGAAGRVLRAVERRLLRRVSLVLTSSPAFAERHFRARQHFRGPVRVEENRLLELDGDGNAAGDPPTTLPPRVDGPPWRIGWFGMLRCRRSLALLRDLVSAGGGRIEVLVAGIPSHVEFEDFDRDVANLPGLSYAGRYTAADLPRLYGAVDLAWAIDYFEEGLNSTWLLPNRLYESLAFGAVPVALASVETGRWLDRHGVGLRVEDPVAELGAVLATTDAAAMARLRTRIAALPRALLVAGEADCRSLVAAVAGEAA